LNEVITHSWKQHEEETLHFRDMYVSYGGTKGKKKEINKKFKKIGSEISKGT
jgi:hypothetical protein